MKYKEEHPIRLDHYLKAHLSLSREKIKKQIQNTQILVNQNTVKAGYLLQKGDEIYIPQTEVTPEKLNASTYPDLDLLYEDESLLVLNKPKALLVHPVTENIAGTLAGQLSDYCSLSSMGGEQRPGLVHRLDRDTEGVMVIAKTNAVHSHLKTQFQERKVTKKYYAMVKGNVMNDHKTLTYPIKRSSKKGNKMKVTHPGDPDGRAATSHLNVIKRFQTKTLLSVEIETGRTHQVRVHLSFMGHPLLGDYAYGKTALEGGQQLQAYFLAFTHPITKQRLSFELPLSGALSC